MHMSQKRVIPRWKEWKPLATQQFRLRNVIQIIGLNIGIEDPDGSNCRTSDSERLKAVPLYYTLHLTAMSAPFYTSEMLKSECPKWKEIDSCLWAASDVFGGITGFVLRLWWHNGNGSDQELFVWGVDLRGLAFLGSNLSHGLLPNKRNTLIFLMPGGYYTCPSYVHEPHNLRITSVNVLSDDLRISYSVNKIHRLSFVQRAIEQKAVEANVIKWKISTGDYVTSDSRRSVALRRLLSRSKVKSNHSDLLKLKESLEIAQFRLQTLQVEKKHLSARLVAVRTRLEATADGNQLLESRTMEKYRLLQREVHAHREWLVGYVQRREAHLHAKALLHFRIKQLISELQFIYPVEQVGDKFTICGIHLPDSENLIGVDDLQISVALGFIAHTVHMISVFLQVPLRYPVVHIGSRSRIVDLIADKMPDSEREFPLFCKGKDKLQFNYAVYLLNKNVAALRWLCGLPTIDLRCTLPNLAALLRLGCNDLPSEPTLRSPASSTLDLASSSFSISSPVQSNFHSCNVPYRQIVSATTGDIKKQTIIAGLQASPGQISPHPSLAPRAPVPVTNTNSITNNLSYSLDKGLNEIEENKKKSQWLEADLALSNTTALTMGGSESNLPRHISQGNSVEDAATSVFLKHWEAEKNNVMFSDEDSDFTNSEMLIKKTVSLENACCNMLPADELTLDLKVDSDRVSVGLEVCDDSFVASSGDGREKRKVSEADGSVDTLLDNVANRTEALVNQASSFNMFRARFRNTPGSSD